MNDCGKTRYPDKKAALSAINYRARRRHDHGHGRHNTSRRGKEKALRAYPCPDCRGWHLTSNVPRGPRHDQRPKPRANRALIHRYD